MEIDYTKVVVQISGCIKMTLAEAIEKYGVTGVVTGDRLRPELRGLPKLKNMMGPCYGGEEIPIRYETWPDYYALCV